MKLSTVAKRVKLTAIPVVVALIAIPTVFILGNDNQNGAKTVNLTSLQTKHETKAEGDVAPVQSKQAVDKPLETETPVAEATPEPTEPVNPYPEGFNIWHAFNRRAELGLATPNGPPSDGTYCQISHGNSQTYDKPTVSNTPSLYAIACNKNVAGIVESINADGSITLSCTNCGQWNVLSTRTIPADSPTGYLYLQ